MPSISLSCLVALAITSSTMMIRSGDSGHSCLVPFLWEMHFILAVIVGKAFNILLSMIFAIAFLVAIYQVKKISFCSSLLRLFYHE